MGTPALPAPTRPRTIFYIDGFNLYYGAVRATPALKWLDLERYCKLLRPHDDIILILYFSALVSGPTRPNQETYLRALSTTPLVEVVLGKFKQKTSNAASQHAMLPGRSGSRCRKRNARM